MEQNQSGRNLTAVIPPRQPLPAAQGPDDPRFWAGTLLSELEQTRATPSRLQISGLEAWAKAPQRGRVKLEMLGATPRVSGSIGAVRVDFPGNWGCDITLRTI